MRLIRMLVYVCTPQEFTLRLYLYYAFIIIISCIIIVWGGLADVFLKFQFQNDRSANCGAVGSNSPSN